MMKLKSLLAGALCGALFVAQASAFDGEIGSGHVLGNPTAAQRSATDATLTAMFDRAFCSTATSIIIRTTSWVCATTLPAAVQANITAVGTIASGTWNGTRIDFAHLAQGSALSVLGVTGNATADNASIAAGTDNQVLRRSGTALAFGQVNLASTNAVTGALALGNGGTGQTTAPLARASSGLNIDAITTHGDSIYTILSTDRVVATSAALTASRAWTLPAANAVNAGQMLIVADLAGGVTSVNTIVITRAGADTINGGTTVTINAANNAFALWSDGVSKWTAQAQSAIPGTGTVTSAVVAAGTGISVSGTCTITTTGTCTVTNSGVVTVKKQSFCPSGCTTTVAGGGTGTYTPSTGMIYAQIECVGSGAGGGGTTGGVGQISQGGGGGSGGYSRVLVTAASVGASKTVTMGAAGTGGSAGVNNGGNGNDVSVGTLCIAKGGSGGGGAALNSGGSAGAGGVAGTGDIAAAGSPGGAGTGSSTAATAFPSAVGGSSIFGGGAAAIGAGGTSTGNSGSNYGAGGGGGVTYTSASGSAGGNGSVGIVYITEYNSQ